MLERERVSGRLCVRAAGGKRRMTRAEGRPAHERRPDRYGADRRVSRRGALVVCFRRRGPEIGNPKTSSQERGVGRGFFKTPGKVAHPLGTGRSVHPVAGF